MHHVLLRQGVLGIKVQIMFPWDPSAKSGPKKPLPDRYHKGAKPFPAGRNSGIIELAECRGRGNRKLLFSPPAQRTDRVSVGSVWFPQLSDFLVRPEGLVALGWTCPGTGLTPVPAFRKRSDFHGLLATKDGAAD